MLFIIGGKSNNTDIFETFRAMADALARAFQQARADAAVRGGRPRRAEPGARHGRDARHAARRSGLPYRIFGFDSDMSEVINYARAADAWMKAGGRDEPSRAA